MAHNFMFVPVAAYQPDVQLDAGTHRVNHRSTHLVRILEHDNVPKTWHCSADLSGYEGAMLKMKPTNKTQTQFVE